MAKWPAVGARLLVDVYTGHVDTGYVDTGARLLVSVDQSDHRGQPRQVPAAPPLVIVELRHGDVILRRRHSLALCVLLLQGTGAAGGARGGDAL